MDSTNSVFITSAKQSRHKGYITSRDHMTVIQHYIKHGSKVGLSIEKFNKWLKKPYLNTSSPRGNQSADSDYTSLVSVVK